MRQVSIDTVSSIFGVLDGVTLLDQFREDFAVTYDGGPPLNGDLQDIFLAEYGA